MKFSLLFLGVACAAYGRTLAAPSQPELTKRVVGGEVVPRGEAGFLVSLWFLQPNDFTKDTGLKHVCGGSLIQPGWVLTSAHCFDDSLIPGISNISDWLVVVGENDQNVTESGEQFFSISSIQIYPGYNITVPTNDAALLKLNASVTMNKYASTVQLDRSGQCPRVGDTCTTYGWGQRNETPYGNGSRLPYKAQVTLIDQSTCEQAYINISYITITDLELCAAADGKDACYGDSGGPLVCECRGRQVLTGIVFNGEGCARAEYPGIYERVRPLWSWIKQHTNIR